MESLKRMLHYKYGIPLDVSLEVVDQRVTNEGTRLTTTYKIVRPPTDPPRDFDDVFPITRQPPEPPKDFKPSGLVTFDDVPSHTRSSVPCKVNYTDPATFAVTAAEMDALSEAVKRAVDCCGCSGAHDAEAIIIRIKKGGADGKG